MTSTTYLKRSATAILCVVMGIRLNALQPSFAQSTSAGANIAVVNGEAISTTEWISKMKSLRFGNFVDSISPLRPKPMNAGQIALDSLIIRRLVSQFAKANRLLPKVSEVQADAASAKRQKSISDAIKNGSLNDQDLLEDIRFDRTLTNILSAGDKISAKDSLDYYSRHQELFGQPEQWKLSVIRITGKSQADVCTEKLKSGAPFAKVAAEYSEDPNTKKQGGYLGQFNATDLGMPTFIRDAVNHLRPGEYSQPLESVLGTADNRVYFIVLLSEVVAAKTVPLEQVRDQVDRLATFEKHNHGEARIAELRKRAKISILLPEYRDMVRP